MAIEECRAGETLHMRFFELCISLIIFMILQLLWLGRTVYFEYRLYKKNGKRKNSSITITYIILQFCGFYFTLIDFLRFVVNPFANFIGDDPFVCSVIAYSPKIITTFYFAVYVLHAFLRYSLWCIFYINTNTSNI